jgi:hypothetical protein
MAARSTENQMQPLLWQHAQQKIKYSLCYDSTLYQTKYCKQKTEHWDGYCAFVTVHHMFMASNQLRLGEGRRKILVGILQRELQ